MVTYPIFTDPEDKLKIFAFEIDNTWVSVAGVAKVISAVNGVSTVKRRRLFSFPDDIHITFMYLGTPYIVWEPWGDNSRYWIGPDDIKDGYMQNIAQLENAFKDYDAPGDKWLIGVVVIFLLVYWII